MKKVILAGPPRSGKSCLREGLKNVLVDLPDAPYPYVITACPDGEGAWFQEAVRHDPESAQACKDRLQGTIHAGIRFPCCAVGARMHVAIILDRRRWEGR